MRTKGVLLICFILVISLLCAGCTEKDKEQDNGASLQDKTWEEIVEEANGTTVSFYGWGGNEKINRWLDTTVAVELKERYNISLERVPMVPNEYLPKLLNEKQLKAEGTIDIVWINGENFYNAKNQDLLYGPFTQMLPNFNQFIDTDSPDVEYDFGHPVEGYEAPYGKAQMVFIGETAVIKKLPTNHVELKELAEKHVGKITYPDLTDFTGSAFIRNIIYDIVGYEAFLELEADKEVVREVIQPALDYLVDLKPYLWRQGESYPATIAQLDNMYADGEVLMTMNYTPFHIAGKIADGTFTKTSQSFLFDKGTIGNTHFMGLPFNAPNKAGALVVINHILSPEVQVTKYDPTVWGDLPVTDPNLLNDQQKQLFESVELGEGVIPQDILLQHRVPEMRAELVPIIEELWREVVLGHE
ncbi:ABC transporter substrate-binding protein [Alkaliphilus pronyensis]|uniref:ABC transporter substrate-binding protein n=1 Tax=Alkaliphilus pronyensis TaxID=1482732 RepID=A0A6I0EZD3_9FIRM|nr:ABC transporter substrate-binding protein [Alkaliphilus pronyensis]KAB3535318.1 ABC transporter substrate-binding protein [Alkaliphilus pronyensis]